MLDVITYTLLRQSDRISQAVLVLGASFSYSRMRIRWNAPVDFGNVR